MTQEIKNITGKKTGRTCNAVASSTFPLISVIIPVFNNATTLDRAVQSIQAQTYQHLEIILIDDGSTDNSGERCDQLAAEDERIKVIHQANSGLSAARNAGLKIMRGRYVTFVDSDDSIDPHMIEQLYDFSKAEDLQMVACSFMEVFTTQKGEEQRDFHGYGRSSGENNIFKDALSCEVNQGQYVFSTARFLAHMFCDDGFTTSAWGKLYCADLFTNIYFPVGKLYEDMGTTYKIILQCDRIGFLDAPLYHYYQHHNSIIHQSFSLRKMDLIELTDQACDAVFAQLVSKTYKNQQATPTELADALVLENAIRKRRVHARFSILRQLLAAKRSERKKYQDIESKMRNYIKTHRQDILQNPLSSKRDLAAVYVLSSKTLSRLYSSFKP